jgi:triacylglycerol lipase
VPDVSGCFDAIFTTDLSAARRGWRVGRNRVEFAGHALEACNLVLQPPADSTAALVVILPLAATFPPNSVGQWNGSTWCSELGKCLASLRSLEKRAVHYVAFMSADSPEPVQAELALAATSLAWPAGQFLVLPVHRDLAREALTRSLDRMRWLFAGALDLIVINLEPSVVPLSLELREPAEDWAVVRRHIDLSSNAWIGNGNHEATATFRARGPRSTRAALVPRSPVVFCHGMLAFSMLRMQMPRNLNCFSPLQDFLLERGLRALFPQVPPTAGIAERAACLRDQILHWTDEPVNLVAHSMGGLDARCLISQLGFAPKIRSLTTVCAPHRGTYLADWFLANYRQRVPLMLALEALGVNLKGFRDCQLNACRAFNEVTPDSPDVRYFSYGGQVSPSYLTPVLRRAWSILTGAEGPNDGMVSVASSRWGEYLGTVHADHFAQTPDSLFIRANEDFDSLAFYRRLVEDLARRGF